MATALQLPVLSGRDDGEGSVQVRLDEGTAVLARMSGVLHPTAGDTVHLRVTGLVRAYRPAGSP